MGIRHSGPVIAKALVFDAKQWTDGFLLATAELANFMNELEEVQITLANQAKVLAISLVLQKCEEAVEGRRGLWIEGP